MSYLFRIDPRKKRIARFIGKVRSELIRALHEERERRGLTQDDIARALGTHKSVISRRLSGETNLTLRSIAEMAWAMGYEPDFTMTRSCPEDPERRGANERTTNISVARQDEETETSSRSVRQANLELSTE